MEAAAGDTRCWCAQLPPLPISPPQQTSSDVAANRCFCPDCLRALLAGVALENR
jgi:hypothetical protein